MGLLDFVRSAGKKPEGGVSGPDAIAARIRADVEKLGFRVAGLEVSVADDVVTLTGEAATPTDRRKIVLVAGNTFGVAKVDDRLTVAASSAPLEDAPTAPASAPPAPARPAGSPAADPEPDYYTVESGDTLSKIAKRFYGNAMKYPVIFEANRPMLSDPDEIYPGQKLMIPKDA